MAITTIEMLPRDPILDPVLDIAKDEYQHVPHDQQLYPAIDSHGHHVGTTNIPAGYFNKSEQYGHHTLSNRIETIPEDFGLEPGQFVAFDILPAEGDWGHRHLLMVRAGEDGSVFYAETRRPYFSLESAVKAGLLCLQDLPTRESPLDGKVYSVQTTSSPVGDSPRSAFFAPRFAGIGITPIGDTNTAWFPVPTTLEKLAASSGVPIALMTDASSKIDPKPYVASFAAEDPRFPVAAGERSLAGFDYWHDIATEHMRAVLEGGGALLDTLQPLAHVISIHGLERAGVPNGRGDNYRGSWTRFFDQVTGDFVRDSYKRFTMGDEFDPMHNSTFVQVVWSAIRSTRRYGSQVAYARHGIIRKKHLARRLMDMTAESAAAGAQL